MNGLISNDELAEAFLRIAQSLEDQNESYYRVRAYRKAAVSIKRYPEVISDMVTSHADLTVIPSIGKHLAELIIELITTKNLNWLPQSKPAVFYPDYFSKKEKL